MNNLLRRISVVFSAGCVGGLANSLVVWLFGVLGVSAALGVGIAPGLTPAWLYPRIVWGGLWGGLFLLPFFRGKPFAAGLIYSLGPTLIQLLVVFPFKAQKGLFGLELGGLTPLMVIFFNAIWGITTAYMLDVTRGKE